MKVKMDLRLMIPFFFGALLSCANQPEQLATVKEELVKQLIQTTLTPAIAIEGKIVILKSRYCETADCATYFRDYSEQVQVYSRADIFMRNIEKYLEIDQIDEENGRITGNLRMGDQFQRVDIKI